jgi:hypothetical protein
MEQSEQLKLKCAELQQALLTENPGYRTILQGIHENIREQPELMYVLSDEEISAVVSGLSKHSNVVIAEEKKKAPISRAKAAKLSADDV